MKVPSCSLMTLTEFSAGKVQHKQRSEHIAMWFHFSSDEPLKRNTPFWKEKQTYPDKLTVTSNPEFLFICWK